MKNDKTNTKSKYVTTEKGIFYKEEINIENFTHYYIYIKQYNATLDQLIYYTKSLISKKKRLFYR